MPKYIESVVATTLLDKQNEKLSLEGLNSLVSSLERYNIPLNIEHDPRMPPIGRVIKGYVRERSDHEFEAVALLELFDNEMDKIENNNKDLRLHESPDQFVLGYSFSHKNGNDLNEIKEIEILINSKAFYEAKKSADPISIISLTGAFVIGGIATGFLNQIGVNLWEKLKPKLVKLSSKNKTTNLLVFRMLIKNMNISIEIEIILTNPVESDLDTFINKTTYNLDQVLEELITSNQDIRKIVFEQKNNFLILKYALTNNGIPLFLNRTIENFL